MRQKIYILSASISLQQRFDALRPGLDLVFRRFKSVSAFGIELHLQLASHICTSANAVHILDHVTGPAAVGHKRHNGLACKILSTQECLDGGSHRVPPCRRADGDDVVVGDADREWLELRRKATFTSRCP